MAENTPYTFKSQYLKDATLTGNNNANLTGNSRDNILQGNAGNNTLQGSEGTDTAVFKGLRSDYTILKVGSTVTVTDIVAGRDGTDTVLSIEQLKFSDQTISVSSL